MPNPIIGTRIKQLLTLRKLELGQLSALSNVEYSLLLRITGSRISTSGENLARIARVLHTSSDYLLGSVDDPSPTSTQTQKAKDRFESVLSLADVHEDVQVILDLLPCLSFEHWAFIRRYVSFCSSETDVVVGGGDPSLNDETFSDSSLSSSDSNQVV